MKAPRGTRQVAATLQLEGEGVWCALGPGARLNGGGAGSMGARATRLCRGDWLELEGTGLALQLLPLSSLAFEQDEVAKVGGPRSAAKRARGRWQWIGRWGEMGRRQYLLLLGLPLALAALLLVAAQNSEGPGMGSEEAHAQEGLAAPPVAFPESAREVADAAKTPARALSEDAPVGSKDAVENATSRARSAPSDSGELHENYQLARQRLRYRDVAPANRAEARQALLRVREQMGLEKEVGGISIEEVAALLVEVEEELDRLCRSFIIGAKREEALGRTERAAAEALRGLRWFPDESHPCRGRLLRGYESLGGDMAALRATSRLGAPAAPPR